jgi:tetratricopeptide (TPR) repeat protein
VRAFGRAGVFGLALALAAGCAARQSAGLESLLVRQTDGTVTTDATFDVAPRPVGAERAEPVGEPVPVVPVPKFVAPDALEDRDAALGAALLALAAEESVAAHRLVAAEYWRLKVFDRAERHLTRALALQPRDPALLEERARLWRDAGVQGRALADAHRAAYLAPASAAVQNTLGTVLFALGRVAEARGRFARAVALDPGAAYLQSNLCYAALAGREFLAALSACDAALRLSPDFEAAQKNRALVTAAMAAAPAQNGTEGRP